MRTALDRYFASLMLEESESGGGAGATNNANPGGNKGGGSETGKGKDFTPITSQDDLDDIIDRRLKRAQKSWSKDLREEIEAEIRSETEAEEAKKKGDVQKLLDAANKTIEKLEGELKVYQEAEEKNEKDELRKKIAKQHKLSDDAYDLIVGDDEEAMKASAKKLAKIAKIDDSIPEGDQGRTNNERKREAEVKEYDKPEYWGIHGR